MTAVAERRPVLRPSEMANLAGVDTGREPLSHTHVSLWLACHRKFELHYLKRLELIERPRAFTLGSAFQRAIEYQDPDVGVQYLNGFEPCAACERTGLASGKSSIGHLDGQLRVGADPCTECGGDGWTGEPVRFCSQETEDKHRVNEAVVRAASALYLRCWPGGPGEVREFEYRVQLRSPWTGAYSRTFDLWGFADGLIDPMDGLAELAADVDPRELPPLEIVENKLVGQVSAVKVQRLPLDRQLALARYGIWRATGRPVQRVYSRRVKKPSIKQRKGRAGKDGGVVGAETLEQFIARIAEDYEERPLRARGLDAGA